MNAKNELHVLKLAAGEWEGIAFLKGEQLPRCTSREEMHEEFIKTGLMTIDSIPMQSDGSNYAYFLTQSGRERLEKLRKDAGEEKPTFEIF
ncbi:hypothetical protein [Marinomonas transparens]|uniref:Uncharacterized protein n=1 Tax=Marinomonas transparens TaxID=2795388 RepID=A0A934JTA5_9GAMM|nr:hypothetical protein [Marinomonas transparens]MBJ7536975.1 hypothetical protein [Marinomonas transparens]